MPEASTTADPVEPTPPVGQRHGGRWVGILGEILITAGVLLLLVVVYELWWTNVLADGEAAQQREELQNTWREGPSQVASAPIPAEAFGLMYIPRIASDVWEAPLIEGVDESDLTKGIGHFPTSVLPGELGNSAYAGHRATHGEPLANVDQLQVGDMVYIETGAGWYSYRLTGEEIVEPTDVWVVDPVPGQPADTPPTRELLTLVTCHPRWGSTQRWVWWGEMTEVRSKGQGPPPELAAMLSGV